MADSVRVVCRFRPQNKREDAEGGTDCVDFESEQSLSIRTPDKPSGRKFNFDRIFPPTCTQEQVYNFAAKPLVAEFFKGFNGTIFVYGQTGSGKSHTMTGPSYDDKELRGIIPRVIDNVFERIEEADEHMTFTLSCSYVEIYMEKIRDLLCPKNDNLQVRESKEKGIYIEDVSSVFVDSPQRTLQVMQIGTDNRIVAATQMNAVSSRSHSLFFFNLTQEDTRSGTKKSGKLYLVDLAGSEKIAKTGVEGQRLDEAKAINQSLSALGNVINALTDPKAKHIPYRDSKLTRILQESLGGNAKTTLIICCSCSSFNDQETLSTLRFGDRAKSIKNKAQINQELSVAELKKLLDAANREIARLKRLNGIADTNIEGAESAAVVNNTNTDEQIIELKKIIEKQEEDISKLNIQLEESTKQLEDLQRESEDANSKYLTVQAEFDTYKETASLTEDELLKTKELLQQVNDEKIQINGKIATTENQIELLNARIKSLEEENKVLSVEMSENLIKNGPAGKADCGEVAITGGSEVVINEEDEEDGNDGEDILESDNELSSINETDDEDKRKKKLNKKEKEEIFKKPKKSIKAKRVEDLIENKFSGEADMDLIDSIFNAEDRAKDSNSLAKKITDYLAALSKNQLASFYKETFDIVGQDKIGSQLSLPISSVGNSCNSSIVSSTPGMDSPFLAQQIQKTNRRATTGSTPMTPIFVNPTSNYSSAGTPLSTVAMSAEANDDTIENSDKSINEDNMQASGTDPLPWEKNKELFGLLKIIVLEGICQGQLFNEQKKGSGIDLELVREQFEMLNKFISSGSSESTLSSLNSTPSALSMPSSNPLTPIGSGPYGLANTSIASARRRATIGNTTMLANISAFAAQNGLTGINTTMNTSLLQSQMMNCSQMSGARDLSMMLNENGMTASQKNAIKREYQKTISQYRKQNKLLTAQVELLKQRFILLTKQRVESELASTRQIEELAAKCGQSDKLLVASEAKRLGILEKYRNTVCLAADGEKQSRFRQLSEVATEYKRDVESLQIENAYMMRRVKALTINLCNAKAALDDARAEMALLRQRNSQLNSSLLQQQSEILTTATIKDEFIAQYTTRCEVQQRLIHKLSQKTLNGARTRFLTFSGIDFNSLNDNNSQGFTTNTLVNPISVNNGANVSKFKRILRGGRKNQTLSDTSGLPDSSKIDEEKKKVGLNKIQNPQSLSSVTILNQSKINNTNGNDNDDNSTLNDRPTSNIITDSELIQNKIRAVGEMVAATSIDTSNKNENEQNDEEDANLIALKNSNNNISKDSSELVLNLARYVKKNASLITQLNAILSSGETTEDTALFFIHMFSGKKEKVNLYDANGLETINDQEIENNLEKVMESKEMVNNLLLPSNTYVPAPTMSLIDEQIHNNNSSSKHNISINNCSGNITNSINKTSENMSFNSENTSINKESDVQPTLDTIPIHPRLPRPPIKTLKLHREKLLLDKQNELITSVSGSISGNSIESKESNTNNLSSNTQTSVLANE